MSKRVKQLYIDDILDSISAIKDFRNFIVHEYFGIDTKIIWDLTTLELDELLENIKKFDSDEYLN